MRKEIQKKIKKSINNLLESYGYKITRHKIIQRTVKNQNNFLINSPSNEELFKSLKNEFNKHKVKVFFFKEDGENYILSLSNDSLVKAAQILTKFSNKPINKSLIDSGNLSLCVRNKGIEYKIQFNTFIEEEDYIQFKHRTKLPRRFYKKTLDQHDIFSDESVFDYSKIIKMQPSTEVSFPIDLVFTWVNADDPDWQKLYEKFNPSVKTDANNKSRFHSRDELKYALRSWDLYASFINKIYIVSNCSAPSWLDLSNERIKWVSHEEIFPTELLPTFSSHAIETRLHKIKGLSNHFIYSNDDFLITRPASAQDFFYPNGIAKVRLEAWGSVNGNPILGQPDYLNAARNCNLLLEERFNQSTTQLVTHSPQALRKDVLEEIENIWPQELMKTTENKFRAINDIALTGYMHAHYAIITGRAVADTTPIRLVQQNHDYSTILATLVRNKKSGFRGIPLSVCVNDGQNSHENVSWNTAVTNFLEEFYPYPSSFEKRK